MSDDTGPGRSYSQNHFVNTDSLRATRFAQHDPLPKTCAQQLADDLGLGWPRAFLPGGALTQARHFGVDSA